MARLSLLAVAVALVAALLLSAVPCAEGDALTDALDRAR